MVKYITFIFALLFVFDAQSQISFYKQYNGTGHDYGHGVVELPDTSYMVCGSSTSFFNGAPQAYMMKLDSMGNHLWSKHYGGLETESAERIFYTEGEGFYLAGHTNTTTTGDFNFYLIHTDSEGELLWEKNYGTDSWDILTDAIKLPDSSYVMVGETFNPIDGEKDGYIIRLDKFGDTLWTRSSGHLGEDSYTDVLNFYDTSFVVAGKTWNADSTLFKSYMACFKMDGALLWENQYGPDGNYEVNSIVEHDEYIIGVGSRVSPIDNLADEYVVKVTNLGALNFTFSYGGLGHRSYDFIAPFGGPNDFYMAFSNDDAFTTGPGQDLYIAHFNELVGFQNTGVDIDGEYDDLIGEIVGTVDNGAVAVGTNNDVVFEIPNIYVMKIGPNQSYPITFPKPTPSNILDVEENKLVGVDIKIFPNPTKDQLNVSISELKTTGEFSLVDLTGKVVQTSALSSEFTSIDVSSLEKGIYLIKLTLDNGQELMLGKVEKN